jgi:hypothetical protein
VAAQPSSTPTIVRKPYNLELHPVINLSNNANLANPPNTMDCGRSSMEFFPECMVDFEILRVNGRDIEHLFIDQQWKNYFEMLNGFVYYDIVRNFWVKAYVSDQAAAKEEVRKKMEDDQSLRGKSRAHMGLRPFKGIEIRSNILGLKVVITKEHIAKMLGLDNEGENISTYKSGSKYEDSIKQDLFHAGTVDYGRSVNLKPYYFGAFRILIASIITRGGGTYTISWPHKHFIWFMLKRLKSISSLMDIIRASW